MQKGILLINLGTPDNPNKASVQRYLREFLSDERVIDLPSLVRYPLTYGIIIPLRASATTHAYQSIWTKEGSPLRFYSERLCNKLQTKLGERYLVTMGMRYGQPNLRDALHQLRFCDTVTVLPLYPQYSSAATGSSIEYVLKQLLPNSVFPTLHIIRDFYQHPAFIQTLAQQIKPYIASADHLLLSYHGLPERHLHQAGCQNICTQTCPPKQSACYRAQCFQTSRALAQALELEPEKFSTSFQSRLGRTPWIKPYTDTILPDLANRGIKRLAVACPSFVTDCLETLEEIGMRAQQQWLELGGEQFTLIPCLNDQDDWVDAVMKIVD